MKKRIKFEASGDEQSYVKKCMNCIHQYTRQDESDTLFCSCKSECKYKKVNQNSKGKE